MGSAAPLPKLGVAVGERRRLPEMSGDCSEEVAPSGFRGVAEDATEKIGCTMEWRDTMTSVAEVVAALDEDLLNLRDPRVHASIRAYRLPSPKPIRLTWDYGKPGDTLDGWLVFEDAGQRTGIVYCGHGFGPTNPWGLIITGETCPSMGMDSGWFRRFIEAYFDSFSATDLPIWRVVRWTKDDSCREPLTAELPWEEAWRILARFKEEDPERLYSCEHSIVY